MSDARQTGRLWQATFRHFLHGMSDDLKSVKIGQTYFDTFEVLPLPAAKGGEAFRGIESDGASHLAANRSGSGASEEFVFCRRKRRLVRNQ